jgi:hypothetical protein
LEFLIGQSEFPREEREKSERKNKKGFDEKPSL